MSGYVLCLGYFKTRDKKRLVTSACKRYIRLVPPILISNVLICLLMMAGAFRNVAVSEISGSSWLAGFNRSVPNLLDAVLEALFGCFFVGTNQYNGVLWTIPFLFLGALFVYAIAWLIGDKKWRYVVYTVLGVGLVLTDYAGVIWGFILCDVINTQEKLVSWVKKQKVLLWLVFILGFYLSSYPSGGAHLENTIYGMIPIMVIPYHLAGALLLVGSVVCLEPLQKFFGLPVFVKLGKISYSLYLVHFPIIATFGCGLFEIFYRNLSYNIATLVCFGVTTAVVGLISVGFSKYIEPLGKAGEKYVEQKLKLQEK
jgi:peptidoglycan/LPS O-acetylase OafA/YrhL